MDAPDPHDFRVVIGAREIYDAVLHVSGQVTTLTQQMIDQATRSADHETRIRSVERKIWALPSAATLLAVASVVIDFVHR